MEMLTGNSGLPKIHLQTADGAQAEIYLHGGHVTSWIPAGGTERLFISNRAEFRSGAALRGGIPVIFPQFSGRGSLPKHGFAWTSNFTLHASGDDWAALRLIDSEETRTLWPHHFWLDVLVRIKAHELSVRMTVQNNGTEAFPFTGALHTYLLVNNLDEVTIEGLGGGLYEDHTAGGSHNTQAEDHLRFTGEVDRLYVGAGKNPVVLREPAQVIEVTAHGFPDVVVWNPGSDKTASIADLEPGDYRRFVCIEAAAAATPVTLAPGEVWEGTQVLTIL